MAEPKVKKDHSRRFVLRGGKHDHHGKKAGGFKLRVYPTYPRWDGDRFTAAAFEDEVIYDGEIYVFPETQHPTQPYLIFLRLGNDDD